MDNRSSEDIENSIHRPTSLEAELTGFLSFQVDYWDSPWQNRHAFLWELSKRTEVLFSGPSFYLPQLLDPRIPVKTQLKSGVSQIRDGLYSHVPSRLLPHNYRFKRLDLIIRSIREFGIRRHLSTLGIQDPTILVWHPVFASMLERFGHRKSVYYKYDNYSGYSDRGGSTIGQDERELIQKVDVFAVTSQGLRELHQGDRDDIALIPNGVDYSFFASCENNSIPLDIATIPGPRIGYIGVINEKVDFRLLLSLCSHRRDWSIVLVGPVRVKTDRARSELSKLEAMPNFFLLGQKEGRDVPPYIYALDVAMMCYVVNDWTYFGYPLKMHEYLACGKPVVSADLPAVREFREVVSILGDSHSDWIDAVERCLEERNDTDKINVRRRSAKMNSWGCRVEKLLELL